MKSLRHPLPLLVLAASVLLPAAAAHAGKRDVPDATFRFDRPESHVQDVRAAGIERSVRSVNWFLRGFARSRLKQVATACPEYRIVVRDPHFEVFCNGATVFEWTLGKTGTWTTETGDVVGVTLVELPSAFDLHFDAGDGAGKRFHYAWDDQGHLAVTQTITSPHLPVPVQYTLTYKATPQAR